MSTGHGRCWMVTRVHCPCGHQETVAPDVVKRPLRCKACGAKLLFASGDTVHWLVAEEDGPSTGWAVSIPLNVPLKIGSAAGSWIVVPPAMADDRQVELTLKPDTAALIKHVGKDKSKGTWINQARILSGVLHDGDVLRIGSWSVRLLAHSVVLALSKPIDCHVVPDEEHEELAETPAAPVFAGEQDVGTSRTRALKITAMAVVTLFAWLFVMRSMVWPGVSTEMPRETTFYCAADGTVFRAQWSNGPPKCPHCGQVCLGPIRYKPEADPRRPTSMPKSETSTANKKPSGIGSTKSGGG